MRNLDINGFYLHGRIRKGRLNVSKHNPPLPLALQLPDTEVSQACVKPMQFILDWLLHNLN